MAEVTIILRDTEDANGEAGMDIQIPDLNRLMKEQQQNGARYTISAMAALMIYRMLETNVFQPQIGIWCRDLISEMQMEQVRRDSAGLETGLSELKTVPAGDNDGVDGD